MTEMEGGKKNDAQARGNNRWKSMKLKTSSLGLDPVDEVCGGGCHGDVPWNFLGGSRKVASTVPIYEVSTTVARSKTSLCPSVPSARRKGVKEVFQCLEARRCVPQPAYNVLSNGVGGISALLVPGSN